MNLNITDQVNLLELLSVFDGLYCDGKIALSSPHAKSLQHFIEYVKGEIQSGSMKQSNEYFWYFPEAGLFTKSEDEADKWRRNFASLKNKT